VADVPNYIRRNEYPKKDSFVHNLPTSSSSHKNHKLNLIHANTEAHLPRLKRQLHDATDDGVARHNNGDGRDDDGWLEDIKGQPNDGAITIIITNPNETWKNLKKEKLTATATCSQ